MRLLSCRAGQLELLAFRRAGAYEHCVELFGLEQLLHAADGCVKAQIRTHVDDVADFLVEHLGRQAKGRDIGAHQSARDGELFENVTWYPKGNRSFATVSDAGPAPMQATRLPFLRCGARGSSVLMSSR